MKTKKEVHRRGAANLKSSKPSIQQTPRAYNGWLDKQEPEVQMLIAGALALILLAIPMIAAAAMGK